MTEPVMVVKGFSFVTRGAEFYLRVQLRRRKKKLYKMTARFVRERRGDVHSR